MSCFFFFLCFFVTRYTNTCKCIDENQALTQKKAHTHTKMEKGPKDEVQMANVNNICMHLQVSNLSLQKFIHFLSTIFWRVSVFDMSENFFDGCFLSCLARRELSRQKKKISEVWIGLKRQKIFSVVAFLPRQKNFLSFKT